MDQRKVEAVFKWERPTNIVKLVVFLDWQGIIRGLLKGSP